MKYKSAYFPPISMIQSMLKQELIEIDVDEHYQKNSVRNRCYLASSQGKIMLSVPLQKGKHQQQPIREVRIAYDQNWVGLHLKTIAIDYRKAPFFEYFFPEISQILLSKPKYLIDLNWAALVFIFKVLRWYPTISYHLIYGLDESPTETFVQNPYPQLFENKTNFIPDLSILDLLFCIGPQAKYIQQPT